MRIARVRIGHLEYGDAAGCRVQPAHRGVAVSHVPDVPGAIGDDAVRFHLRRQLEFLHLAGLRIEAADETAILAGPPDQAVGHLQRIARPLSERRHHPLLEGDFDGSGNQRRTPPGFLREMRREVLCGRRHLIGRQHHHRFNDVFPPCLVVPGGARDLPQRMARHAAFLDKVFARTIGQLNRPATTLCFRCVRCDERNHGDGQRNAERCKHEVPPYGSSYKTKNRPDRST